MAKTKKIAIVGTRGIPARYGGFETLVENIAPALALKGYKVTVYARRRFVPMSTRWYRGVRIVHPPAFPTKHLDTVSHTFFTLPHLLLARPKAVLVCNAINAAFCLPMRLWGIKVILNVDGLEWERRKWGLLGRGAYKASAWLASRLAHVLIADAHVIGEFYKTRYGVDSAYIPYGHELQEPLTLSTLENLNLQVGDFYFYVGRLEPENNPEAVLRGFRASGSPKKLILLGDNPYKRSYVERLRAMAGPNVLMPGAIYGEGYRELLFNSFAVIHASEVGGTHPALVEAMGAAKPVLLQRNPQNLEVAGEDALYFDVADPASLPTLIRECERSGDGLRLQGQKLRARARERYSWDTVRQAYLDLFDRMTS
jgi:glycosyltransferase involved in cell wall biosynthesis